MKHIIGNEDADMDSMIWLGENLWDWKVNMPFELSC